MHEESAFSYHFSSSSRVRIKMRISFFSAPLELSSKFCYLTLEVSSPLYLLFLSTDLFFQNDSELGEKCAVASESVDTSKNVPSKNSTCQFW